MSAAKPKQAAKPRLGITLNWRHPVTWKTIEEARKRGADWEEITVLTQSLKWRRLDDVQKLFTVKDNLKKGFHVAKCLKVQISQWVEINYSDEYKRARYGRGLMVCGSRWTCPMCADSIAAFDRSELDSVDFQGRGLGVFMVTPTLSHGIDDTCADMMDALKFALRKMKSGKAYQTFKKQYGIVGIIAKIEITFGWRNGWHVHAHLLFVYELAKGKPDTEEVKAYLFRLYTNALTVIGKTASWEHGLDVLAGDNASVIAQYVAKFGHSPKDKKWNIIAEATSNKKIGRAENYAPMQLLDLWSMEDKRAGAKYVEYCKATKGRQQLSYSKGLRVRLGLPREKADAKKAKALDPMSRRLAMLTREHWEKIEGMGKRAYPVMVAARDGTFETFHAEMEKIGIHVDSVEKIMAPFSEAYETYNPKSKTYWGEELPPRKPQDELG